MLDPGEEEGAHFGLLFCLVALLDRYAPHYVNGR